MLSKYSKLVNEFKGVKEEMLEKKSLHVPPKNQRASKKNTKTYEYFVEEVLPTLADSIEEWSSHDLLYYFKYHAEKNGYRYVITNFNKELSIMNKIRSNFSNIEICSMIEFLYESEQTYLRKDTLTPQILNSNWVNTIIADTKLWATNEYAPKYVNNAGSVKHKREWNDKKKEIKIGEWE